MRLLAIAVLLNAIVLWPEVRIERAPLNDLTFHRAAAERCGQAIHRGEPFMDPWVSEWSLGFPLWRTYQPLPHLVAAGWMTLGGSFALLHYLLMVLVPVSTYIGARLFGLSSIASGIAALLIFAPAESGQFSRYGLSYGASVWRGSGLFPQLFAFLLLVPALGLSVRALDTGRWRLPAAVLIAATALSHMIYGYVALLSLAVMGGWRSWRIALPVLLLIAWYVIPLLLVSG